jgi:hypothetical protein
MSSSKELFAMCDPRISYVNRPLILVDNIPPGILINKDTPKQESYYMVKCEPIINIEEIKE